MVVILIDKDVDKVVVGYSSLCEVGSYSDSSDK